MGLFSRKSRNPTNVSAQDESISKIAYILNVTSSTIREHDGKSYPDVMALASLSGGAVGFGKLILADKRCAEIYGSEVKRQVEKASRGLEVWASTTLLNFFMNDNDLGTDRLDTTRQVCVAYFSKLFGSDPTEREIELHAYQKACEYDLQRSVSLSVSRIYMLYMMTLRALGDKGVPNFREIPVPWTTPEEVIRAAPNLPNILDMNILTTRGHIETTGNCQLECMTLARAELDRLKKRG